MWGGVEIKVMKMHLLKCQEKSPGKNNDISHSLHTSFSLNRKKKNIYIYLSVAFNK